MSEHLELIGRIIEERHLDSAAVTDAKLESLTSDLSRKHDEIGEDIAKAVEALQTYADERMDDANSRNADYQAAQLQELVEARKAIELSMGEVVAKAEAIKDGEKGDTGNDGIAGVDGLDRPLLEPVELRLDKDYDKNTLGLHNGGLWISTKKAVGSPDSDPHSWACILDSMTEMSVDLLEDHSFKLQVRMATGKLIEDTFKIPYPEHKGIWEEGEYLKGEIVTKGSAFFQAITDTDMAPPGNGWQQILVAPRGKQGPAGKSIQGPQGKPGRNGLDAVLPDNFVDDIMAIASERKAFEDGRSDSYAITSFRGYFAPDESYRAGDLINFDGGIYLNIRSGNYRSIASDSSAWELVLGVPQRLHVPYMFWQGQWVQKTYATGHVVRDNGWTMVATTETNDRPAPQPIGAEEWVSGLSDTPTWDDPAGQSNPTTEILYGQRYSIAETGYATSVRLWVDQADANIFYSVSLVQNPLDGKPNIDYLLPETSFASTGWFEIPITPILILENNVFDIAVRKYDRTASVSDIYAYDYSTPNNPGVPGAGNITHARSNPEELRINILDDGGTDRSGAFAIMQPGDRISGAGIVWNVVSIADAGTYYAFEVTPAVNGTIGVHDFIFTTFTPQPIAYAKIDDLYADKSNVTGFYSEDGPGAASLLDTGYGVDLEVQAAYISSDWGVITPADTLGGTASARVALTPSQADWTRASSEGYDTEAHNVTTVGNDWTEFARYEMAQGDARKVTVSVDGKRQTDVGYYSSVWNIIAWNDNGVESYADEEYEIGITTCEMRVRDVGNEMILEVKGQATKTWDFQITLFVRSIT